MARTLVRIYRLIELFHLMESGHLTVPRFQRPYVWKKDEVQNLLKSINRGYPIGMLIALQGAPDEFPELERSLSLFPAQKAIDRTDSRLWLIDGSQRMAALYNSVYQPDGLVPIIYDLVRQEFKPVKQGSHHQHRPHLLQMSLLFDTPGLMNTQARMANERDADILVSETNALRERFYSYQIPMLVLENVNRSELVDIFATINTTGRSLTRNEIMHAYENGPDKK